jgi:hypothetical protein
LALAKKELQQTRNDNQVLTQYIYARRKKEEARKKEAQKRRRRRPGGRRPSKTWWWPDGPMRAKAPRMSELGGSSPPRTVQGLSLLQAFMYLLLNDF